MGWRALVLIAVVLGASPGFAQEPLPENFYGEWRGAALTVADPQPGLELTAEDLNVRIEAEDDGFRIRWTALGHEAIGGKLSKRPIDALFAPTARPGVFALDPEHSSLLMGLFADPVDGNPLEGETLLWARLDGTTLMVYSLTINSDGSFDLGRHARTLTDEGMAARLTHRIEDAPPLVVEGLLKQVGG